MAETSPGTSEKEPQVITEYETMMYKRLGKTAYIMFNRPQALNAVNDQFEEDLHSALLEFDLDDEAWVAIIHGAGARTYCHAPGRSAVHWLMAIIQFIKNHAE